MTRTKAQASRNKLATDKAHARNLRKQRNQSLTNKQRRRTRAQRRQSVASYRRTQGK